MSLKPTKKPKQNSSPSKVSVPKKSQSEEKHTTGLFIGLVIMAVTALVTAVFTSYGNIIPNLIGDLSRSPEPPVHIYSVDTTKRIDEFKAFEKPFVLSKAELSQHKSSDKAWLESRGAVDTNWTDIQFTIEGNRSHTVRITNIYPIIISRQSPLKGTLFYTYSMAGDISTKLLLDLDNPNTALGYTTEQDNTITEKKDYFGTYTVSLKQDEQFTFKVQASTRKYFYKFTLAMTILDGDKTVTETITNNRQPFQITATPYKNNIDTDPSLSPDEGIDFSAYQVIYFPSMVDEYWHQMDPSNVKDD